MLNQKKIIMPKKMPQLQSLGQFFAHKNGTFWVKIGAKNA
jgi:hypothetical protein